MNKKGNILIVILSILALVGFATAGYFYWQNQNPKSQTPTVNPTKPTPVTDETANWKTFSSNKYQFSLQYPGTWETQVPTPTNDFEKAGILEFISDKALGAESFLEIMPTQGTSFKLQTESIERHDWTNKSGSMIKVDGVDAFIQTGINSKGILQKVVIFENGQFIFKFYTALANEPETFNKILSTFKFITTQSNNNIFTYGTIKVGDKIGLLTVKSILPYESSRAVSSNNFSVIFTGKVALTGEYFQLGPGGMFDSRIGVCFNKLSPDSLIRVPVTKEVENLLWFCFVNKGLADKEFPTGTGTATIEIDNFTFNAFPSEVWNTANLVKVVSKNEK